MLNMFFDLKIHFILILKEMKSVFCGFQKCWEPWALCLPHLWEPPWGDRSLLTWLALRLTGGVTLVCRPLHSSCLVLYQVPLEVCKEHSQKI